MVELKAGDMVRTPGHVDDAGTPSVCADGNNHGARIYGVLKQVGDATACVRVFLHPSMSTVELNLIMPLERLEKVAHTFSDN